VADTAAFATDKPSLNKKQQEIVDRITPHSIPLTARHPQNSPAPSLPRCASSAATANPRYDPLGLT
jgi:hypothetical protein